MRFKISFVFAFALLLSVSALTASAQTLQINGKVTLKQADGTEVPVQDALLTFYRTDISGKYDVKTNKKGEYVRLGIPYGKFMVVISAPNARPTYQPNVDVARQSTNNFVLTPGDGRVLTFEEAKAAAATPATPAAGAAATAGAGTAPAAAPVNDAEALRLAEEERKKIAEIEARNARATSFNEKLPQLNALAKTGSTALNDKKYNEAIAAYDEGIALEPLGVFYRGKSIALRNRGIDSYNSSIKSKDKAALTSARADLKAATDSAEKAVVSYRETEKSAVAADKTNAKADILTALADRAESYRVASRIGVSETIEAGAKAMQEYVDSETDAAKKAKFEIALANALRDSGKVDEAIAIYRRRIAANQNDMEATFGLGMALQFDEPKLVQNAPEVISLMKQVLAKDSAADNKQAATDSIASMEAILQQPEKSNAGAKPRNTRRRN